MLLISCTRHFLPLIFPLMLCTLLFDLDIISRYIVVFWKLVLVLASYFLIFNFLASVSRIFFSFNSSASAISFATLILCLIFLSFDDFLSLQDLQPFKDVPLLLLLLLLPLEELLDDCFFSDTSSRHVFSFWTITLGHQFHQTIRFLQCMQLVCCSLPSKISCSPTPCPILFICYGILFNPLRTGAYSRWTVGPVIIRSVLRSWKSILNLLSILFFQNLIQRFCKWHPIYEFNQVLQLYILLALLPYRVFEWTQLTWPIISSFTIHNLYKRYKKMHK